MSTSAMRCRLTRLVNLELELTPAELRELCTLRLDLRKALFAKLDLEKR